MPYLLLQSILPAAGLIIGFLMAWWWQKRIAFTLKNDLAQMQTQWQNAQVLSEKLRQDIQWLTQQDKESKSKLAEEAIRYKDLMLTNIQSSNEASRRKALMEAQEKQAGVLEHQLQQEHAKHNLLQKEMTDLQKLYAQSLARGEALQQRLTEQQQQMQAYGEQLKREFQLLADHVLTAKASSFNQQQETKLNDLLNPVRQKLEEFKQDIAIRFSHASTERTRLEEQVKLMADLNQKLSRQAENLTKALTSQVKQQGNWGEEILETILQYVGLQKDIHYQVQHTAANHEGQTIRPDFVVRYPDDRYVIIDSKVSLLHYQRFSEAEVPEEQQQWLTAMARSVKQHIDGLAGKQYQHIQGSLDYVFLFIPVEGAFITTMQYDHGLWQYAFDRRILLVSPTLLLSGMKLVQELWKQDAVNKNARQMADRAGRLYDKLALFVDSFEEIGQRLQQAAKAFAQADGQLRSGKGNALAQAEAIKKLKANASKDISGAIEDED